jgi:putative oxidoreductase
LAARGVPSFLAYPAVAAEFFGGLALLLGVATRYAVLVVLIFTIVATGISHRYWEFTEAVARRVQEGNFYKNLAIIGATLVLFVAGPRPLQCRWVVSRKSELKPIYPLMVRSRA